jgi:predicted transposase/invertase (TIGR01784 family)
MDTKPDAGTAGEGRQLLSLRNDYVFRKVFGRNTDILADFLGAALDMPPEEFEDLQVRDPELLPRHGGGKLSRLDVKAVTRSGMVIDVEIQQRKEKDLRERFVHYSSRHYSGQMTAGQGYGRIRKVVTVVVAGFDFVEGCRRCRSRFKLYDPETGICFTESFEIVVLELPKLPAESDGSRLWGWMRLIDAREEDVMEGLAKGNPAIRKAVGIVYEMSADERERELAMIREFDEIAYQGQLAYEREEGERLGLEIGELAGKELAAKEIAAKLLAGGMAREQVSAVTGLSPDDL